MLVVDGLRRTNTRIGLHRHAFLLLVEGSHLLVVCVAIYKITLLSSAERPIFSEVRATAVLRCFNAKSNACNHHVVI